MAEGVVDEALKRRLPTFQRVGRWSSQKQFYNTLGVYVAKLLLEGRLARLMSLLWCV